MKQSLKEQFMRLRQKKIEQQNSTNQALKQIQPQKQKHHQQKLSTYIPHPQKPPKQAKDLFKNIIFCFPHVDIQLTKKQINGISKLILAQGGKIVQFQDHLWYQPIQYVLISPKARIQVVQKKIEGKINYIDILDYNWVQCCISQGETIDPSSFSLIKQKQEQKKQFIQEQKHESGKKKRKISENSQRSHTQQLPSSDSDMFQGQKKQKKFNKDKFFCQKGKQQDKPALNKFIQQQLNKLQQIYANQRDIGRRIAYGKAASAIRMWKQQIKTQQDVDRIPNIGPKINKKIKQIVTTGKLTKLQQLNQSQQVVAMGQLSKVWGIGPAKAKQLYKQGIKSIQQLCKNQSSLNRNQKIGLKYLQDFQKRIPRQKVTKMFQFVRKTLGLVTKTPQAYIAEVCGSYRRGKQTCGDMDIIITRRDGVFEKDLLVKLVGELQKSGFLTDNLSQPKCQQGHVSTSYMGVCKFEDQTHHRIDIKHYPLEQFAFAILYFTGSGMFNRSMRLYATTLGLQLSDKGFVRRPQKNGVQWTKPIPLCYNQKDIFDVLGLDYKTPKQRDD